MSAVRLVAVFAENKPGQTARTTAILAQTNLSIRWVTIATSGPFGVMKFLVSDPDLAFQAFRHHGYVASLIEVLVVEVPDRPGALQAAAECLAQHGLNLDNTSGFVANRRAILIMELPDPGRARILLEAVGLRVLSQEEMLSL